MKCLKCGSVFDKQELCRLVRSVVGNKKNDWTIEEDLLIESTMNELVKDVVEKFEGRRTRESILMRRVYIRKNGIVSRSEPKCKTCGAEIDIRELLKLKKAIYSPKKGKTRRKI